MTNHNSQQRPGVPNPAKPRKRKGTYMLPPHEAAELRQMSAAKKVRKSLPKNPMTNKQKMAIAEASKREAAEKLAREGLLKKSVEEGEKNPNRQPLGGIAMSKMQSVWPSKQDIKVEDEDDDDDSSNDGTDDDDDDESEEREKEETVSCPPRKKRKDEDRVLFRPTHRTKKLKEKSRAAKPRDSLFALNEMSSARKIAEFKPEQKVLGRPRPDSIDAGAFFSHLPATVRAKIWRLCVVDSDFFVWPESKTGAEQPDLAMTSRDVRDEVLPIYYSQNTFAIDITPVNEIDDDAASIHANVPGKTVLKNWARAIESSDWFSHIRNWVFSNVPSVRTNEGSSNQPQYSFVSVQVDQKDGIWFAKAVEVHRKAACLLPGRDEYGRCVVQKSPDWLIRAVIQMLDAGRKRDITPKMVKDLLKEIAGHSSDLGVALCRAPGQQDEEEPKVIELDG